MLTAPKTTPLAGITPGDVVRTMGPLGYRMMMGYSNRRFQQAEFDK